MTGSFERRLKQFLLLWPPPLRTAAFASFICAGLCVEEGSELFLHCHFHGLWGQRNAKKSKPVHVLHFESPKEMIYLHSRVYSSNHICQWLFTKKQNPKQTIYNIFACERIKTEQFTVDTDLLLLLVHMTVHMDGYGLFHSSSGSWFIFFATHIMYKDL